ncbi:MAG TPA: helicase-related protein, partial [Turneriella sp.]|nr:helicase-related protein [Turneriella sp.]
MIPQNTPLDVRRFFRHGAAKEAAIHTLHDCRVARIATAFFEPSGWGILAETLKHKEVRLLIGREEGTSERIENLLDDFFVDVQNGLLRKNPELLRGVLQALKNGQLAIKLNAQKVVTTLDARYIYHHAKLYIADEKRALVTSANFTRHGLELSREAGYVVTDADDVSYFVERFDEYFGKAKSVTEEFIEALEELLELRNPNDVYCRSLLEIYDLPEFKAPRDLPMPALYQKPIISRLVHSIGEYGGAFLIASTGLGKTVIAAHTVAALRAQDKITNVVVFSPAGLREMWRQWMHTARVVSEEFSYTALSDEKWAVSKYTSRLMEQLSRARSDTLIILDESHHTRNESDGGDIRRRNQRVLDAVHKGTKILLLTATPYSRGIDDINSQLRLLPKYDQAGEFFVAHKHWKVEGVQEISELSPCTVLTAPTVIRHFTRSDENGLRYIEFQDNAKMYFPHKLNMHSLQFKNPYNNILKKLKQSELLVWRKEVHPEVQGLFGEEVNSGKRNYLFEARLMHQFCSSAEQVKTALDQLSKEGGYTKIRFAKQKELTVLATEILANFKILKDEKLHALIEVVEKHRNEKIVIFCIYRSTARYLEEKLSKKFKTLSIKATADVDADDLDILLDTFAPIANGKIKPGGEENEFTLKIKEAKIDILVATEAISEGFNLQDARVLVNYDLPWSVLHLAQRMGRLMRPWHEPRELFIYNFLPDTMFDEELRHGKAWHTRLERRNQEHQSFASLPVILSKENEAIELES